jgi:hypothetical protein
VAVSVTGVGHTTDFDETLREVVEVATAQRGALTTREERLSAARNLVVHL